MGRSVSTPHNAECVQYTHVEFEEQWEWDDFAEDYFVTLQVMFPSAEKCDEWVGREDHAIAENSFAYFGISEYCGLVAYWILPKDVEATGLQNKWLQGASKRFAGFGDLTKLGTASNGEAFFERR